jgi:signal transduction histidine kinase
LQKNVRISPRKTFLNESQGFQTIEGSHSLRPLAFRLRGQSSLFLGSERLKNSVTVFLCLWLAVTGAHAAEPLRSLAEIRALPAEVANSALPVRIEAVVIYTNPSVNELIVHDGTASCYTDAHVTSVEPASRPKVGDRILLEGVTQCGGFLSNFQSRSWKIIGRGEMPEPYPISADEIFLPRFDTAWVEVPAMVIGVETGGIAYTLAVEVFGHTFKADVPNCPDAAERAASLMQRPVRMRAILATVYNPHRQLTNRHFLLPSFDDLRPTAPAVNANGAPLLTVLELLKANYGPTDLVRLEGVVTQLDTKGFHLRDGSGSAFVQAVTTERLTPGTRVKVEGYGAIAPFRPLLRATRVTQVSKGPPPEPLAMDFHAKDVTLLQMEFVTVVADVFGVRSMRDETILQCHTAGTMFEAILPHGSVPSPPYNPGDRLRLTGICELTTTHPIPRAEWVDGFRIRLADWQAVTLLRRGPWWTMERLLSALGLMTLLAVLGFSGTFFFRRIVRKQAHSISEKLSEQAVHKDRYRIARDIHDDLGANLAQIAMLSELAHSDLEKPAAARAHLDRIFDTSKGLARQLDETVWAINPSHDSLDAIVAFLGNFAQEHFQLAGIHCRFDVPDTLPELTLTSAVRHHLFLAAKEALQNIVKHSGASEAWLRVHMEGEDLVLSLEDNGIGGAALPDGPCPSAKNGNGLENIKHRMVSIGGRFELDSKPGMGTSVRLVLSNAARYRENHQT